jgi:CDP-diacylglycerol--serine O-phosphatidyltransferase
VSRVKVKSDKLKERLSKIPFKGYPITRFIPNMTTLLGLCVGLTAVYHALNQDWERSLWYVVIAIVFDGMDGRLARFFNASSRFGAELDSLSDFVTFGVSPALVAYFFTLHELGRLGWGVVLFFCMCAGLRLARFNTMSFNPGSSETMAQLQKKYFMGTPMPAAGLLMLAPMMLQLDMEFRFSSLIYAGYGILIGILMISKIPTFAFKEIKIQPHHIIILLVVIGIFVIGMMTRPWLTLPIVGVVYLCSFGVSFNIYRKDLLDSKSF